MSKNVEDRVVSITFDNKSFERNINSTIKSLEKLNEALKLPKKVDALQGLASEAKKVSREVEVSSGVVDKLHASFSALQVVGVTALANIANGAVNAAKQLTSMLTIQPLTSGFAEYETQMNAVQTILSNTRDEGTNIEQVNAALNELNKYADQTIYNFTEMTRNIGTFTAAGVGLDESVAAIKGIANLAAVSGSNSQQASTAMYQLSQALATGRVALQDWNSVVNAGMGGELFQNALKRTAEHMGTDVDKLIEKHGSFRESLTKEQWLTSEVLTETLAQISGAYSEADLLAQGYTQDQAAEILALAEDATNAATKVKTVTQLIDTAMEALGSGWAQSWQIIIGDFEEAKELLTGASEIINGMITESAEQRNQMLQGWSDLGGREALIEGISNAFQALLSVIKPIQEAFSEIFPPMTSEKLYALTEGFKNFTQSLILSDEAAAKVKTAFSGIFSVVKLVIDIIGQAVNGVVSFFTGIDAASGGILDVAANFGSFLSSITSSIQETNAFGSAIEFVVNILTQAANAIGNFISSGVNGLGEAFSGVGTIVMNVVNTILNAITSVADGLGNLLGTLNFQGILDAVNTGLMGGLFVTIQRFLNGFTDTDDLPFMDMVKDITKSLQGMTEQLTGILDTARSSLVTWQNSIKADMLLKIAAAVAILAASLVVLAAIDSDKLQDALGAISMLFLELMASMKALGGMSFDVSSFAGIAGMMSMATSLLILSAALKNLSSLNFDEILQGITALTGIALVMVSTTKLLGAGGGIPKGMGQLILLAGSFALFAEIMKGLGSTDWNTLGAGLISMGALMIELSLFTNTIETKGMGGFAVAMTLMALGFKVMSSAVNDFGGLDLEVLIQGVATIGTLMGAMVALGKINFDAMGILKMSVAMTIIANAMKQMVDPLVNLGTNLSIEGAAASVFAIAGAMRLMVDTVNALTQGKNIGDLGAMGWALSSIAGVFYTIADAIAKMSELSFGQMASGLVGIAGAMTALTFLISAMPNKDMGMLAVSFPAIAGSLSIIADAMLKFKDMDLASAASGVLALVGGLGAVAGMLTVMTKMKVSLQTVTMLGIAAAAITLFAGAMQLLSVGGLLGVATSFISLAGSFTVIGVAVKLLKPLIPSIFQLSLSLTTLGGSLIALGAGTAAVGVSLTVLLSSLAASIAIIAAINPMDAAAGIVVMAGAFTAIYVAARLIKPALPAVLQLASSIALLGVSCVGVAAGVTLLIVALSTLGSMGKEQIATIIESLQALIVGFVEMLPTVLTSLMDSFKSILLGVLGVIEEVAPQIAETLLKVLMSTLESLTEYAPMIVGFVLDFIINICNQVGSRIGEVVDAISGLLNNLFTAIGENIAGMDASGFTAALGTFGVLTALVVAFNAIKSMIPGALAGAAGVALLGVEITAALAALGAINQIPGLQEFVSSGGDLLQAVGTALGQFVGGLVGGVLEGVTGTFPQVASNLSQFMMNIQPFILGANMINPGIAENVAALAAAIIAITAADVINGFADFFGLGDMGSLGEKLSQMGTAIMQFSNAVTGIDAAAVDAGASALEKLCNLNLPTEGGIFNFIFGQEIDYATFGLQITQLGLALKAYAAAVKDLDVSGIDASVQAAQGLADLGNALPKEGGLAAAIFGETTNMDAFGDQIVSFAKALVAYGNWVADLKVDAITASIPAAQALSDLASTLPKEGGLAEAIFGGTQDFDSFGEQLKGFGKALQEYGTALAEVDLTTIGNATVKVQTLIGLGNNLSSMDAGGFENASLITKVSDALKQFYDKVAQISFDTVDAAIANIQKLYEQLTTMTGFDGSTIQPFIDAVSQLSQINLDSLSGSVGDVDLSSLGAGWAEAIAGGFDNSAIAISEAGSRSVDNLKEVLVAKEGDFDTEGQTYATKVGEGFESNIGSAGAKIGSAIQSCRDVIASYYPQFRSAGTYLVQGMIDGINAMASRVGRAAANVAHQAEIAAKAALDENSPSKKFFEIGSYAGEGLVNGLSSYAGATYKVGNDVAKKSLEGARLGIEKLSEEISNDLDAQPVITPVIDLDGVKYGIGMIDRAFGSSRGVSLFGTINAINRSTSSNRQNGSLYAVEKQIRKLRTDLNNLPTNTYTVNGVTYDDGSAMSDAVGKMIRLSRVERRR